MEIWKQSTICPLVDISNLGNVRNNITKKIKKQTLSSMGYLRVSANGFNQQRVHILVAKEYVNNPFNNPQVDHINNIKTDNRAENLRWVTQSENLKGRKFKQRKRLSKDEIIEIKIKLKQGELTHVKIAEQFGTTYKNISNINTGFRHSNIII